MQALKAVPGVKQGDLMYVSAKGTSYVLSYPEGKLVGTISVGAYGVCSDSSGNVFIPSGLTTYEYSHGSTKPSASLGLPGSGYACAVDPTTNTLAVVIFGSSGSGVALFKNESGTARVYNTDIFAQYCGYDNDGNLFVDGPSAGQSILAELPSGSGSFFDISITPTITQNPGQIQWYGSYLSVEAGIGVPNENLDVYRLSISGSTATIVGTTSFKGIRKVGWGSWIYGKTIIIPYANTSGGVPNIGYWKYPAGGPPMRRLRDVINKGTEFTGVTISVAK
jgi:hypothetical protein